MILRSLENESQLSKPHARSSHSKVLDAAGVDLDSVSRPIS